IEAVNTSARLGRDARSATDETVLGHRRPPGASPRPLPPLLPVRAPLRRRPARGAARAVQGGGGGAGIPPPGGVQRRVGTRAGPPVLPVGLRPALRLLRGGGQRL